MNLTDVIKGRRSIRKYKEGKVSREQIKSLLEAAMYAPSAGNTKPWEFVVVESREKIEELIKVHSSAGMLKTASLAIIVCAVPTKENPMLAGFFQQDCAAATENLLLAAYDMGLGTCWCGVYPEAGRVESIKKITGVSSIPFSLIAVGIPDEQPPARSSYDASRVKYM